MFGDRERGRKPEAAGTRDEAIALARWCLAQEYGLGEPSDISVVAEQRTEEHWRIDFRDSKSQYRVIIPHGETRRRYFDLERNDLP